MIPFLFLILSVRSQAPALPVTESLRARVEQLPVLIVYWTVSVGVSRQLHYARDVYNLDGAVLRALNRPALP